MTERPDRRHDLTNGMADFVLAQGLDAATLRPLAAAAGVSDRMLLYYFKDKSQAMNAAFACLLDRLKSALDAQTQIRPLPIGRLRGKVVPLLLADDFWPYMQLWLDITARASRGDPQHRADGQALRQVLLDWVQGRLASDDANQRARLMMMIEAAIHQKALGLRDTPVDPDGD